MKTNHSLKPIPASAVIILFLYSCTTGVNSINILDEDFESNTLGWIEEQTDFHYMRIKDGEYFIQSMDTSSGRSSTASMANDYHYNLPGAYQISTAFKVIEQKKDDMHFGMLFYTGSNEYKFSIYSNGWVTVYEYDYNRETSVDILSKYLGPLAEHYNKIQVNFTGRSFELMVNGKSAGTGNIRAESSSWRDLRLYTSTQSAISIDYLRIKER